MHNACSHGAHLGKSVGLLLLSGPPKSLAGIGDDDRRDHALCVIEGVGVDVTGKVALWSPHRDSELLPGFLCTTGGQEHIRLLTQQT